MNLSIIIPNYNGEKLLEKNLPKVFMAIRDYKKGKIEIIIPDDPSSDNSKGVIEKFIKRCSKHGLIVCKTVENKKMLDSGFSKNVNRGVNIATGDILVILNSDVIPSVGFLDPLLKHFDDPDIFAIGCLDESIENGKIVLRGRGIGSFKRGFLIHNAGNTDKKNTLWVSGGSGAFRKRIWDKLKGFDPIYDPFYWEDIDLSYRALKSGYKIVFEPNSIVLHEHEKGTVKLGFDDKYVKKIAYRNQFIFVWKNITEFNMIISHMLWLPYHIIKAFFSGDWEFFGGLLLAIKCVNKIAESRRSASELFVKKDLEIFNNY